jgi:TPR repeat protein
MRAIGHGILGVIVAATTATAAFAQQNPGLSVQPSGRTLAGPEATPMEKPVNLLRPTHVQSTNERSSMDDLLYAPEFQDKPWAQSLLGSKYVRSPQSGEQVSKGLELLNAAAERGEPAAQYELATLYAEGRGVVRDTNLAIFWGRKAADQGNTEAQFSVGKILIESREEEERATAAGYLQKASDSGHVPAVLFWATALGRGQYGLNKDEAKAEALLKPAAERGDADCQMTLASLYRFGDTFAARRDEAQVWLQRAADQGQPKALEILSSEELQRPAGPAGPTE